MLVLSKGFKKPENDDTGDVFWAALAFDIQQLNDHTHNGANSASIPATTQSIAAGSWAAVGDAAGSYQQTVTLPGSLTYDAITIQMRLSTGEVVYPLIEKVSSTQYKVYVNDNSLNLTAVYSS